MVVPMPKLIQKSTELTKKVSMAPIPDCQSGR